MTNEISEADATSATPSALPHIRIEPSRGWVSLRLRELWHYRELLLLLTWRDISVRYKQTALGAAWAVLQPLLTMLIFTLVFSKIAKVSSGGVPYPIFAYTALLPWTYFSQALSRNGVSLAGSANLVSKVYFPRLIVPLSATLAPLVDFCVAFGLLVVMMAWYGIVPTWRVLALLPLILLAGTSALAVGLWLTALNVRYRDVGHTIPFLVQIWMYASPVGYPVSLVPERWRLIYSLNPMSGVIEGFRWSLLGMANPDYQAMALSTAVVLVMLWGGLYYFQKTEKTLADVI